MSIVNKKKREMVWNIDPQNSCCNTRINKGIFVNDNLNIADILIVWINKYLIIEARGNAKVLQISSYATFE